MSDDKRLERIEDKVDLVSAHLASIDVTLAAQHQSLREHIRRTDILEAKLEPVEKHVAGIKGVVSLLKVMALLAAILETMHLLGWIK